MTAMQHKETRATAVIFASMSLAYALANVLLKKEPFVPV